MSRVLRLVLFFVAQLLVAGGVAPRVQAQEVDGIPAYFFSTWTISADCSEASATPVGHVQTGLQFAIDRSSATADGQAFKLRPLDKGQRRWSGGWRSLKLEYRAGSKMSRVPADFDCVPGAESTSPFLAMSGYSVSAEPWYEYEHWYGLTRIHGQLHHVLIFPRDATGPDSVIIVLQDADASDNIKLDHDGAIKGEH